MIYASSNRQQKTKQGEYTFFKFNRKYEIYSFERYFFNVIFALHKIS